MNVLIDTKLSQPAPAFGAVFGDNRRGRNIAFIVYAVNVILFIASLASLGYLLPPDWSFSNFPPQAILPSIGLMIFLPSSIYLIPSTFTYNDWAFARDAYDGRVEYAETVFKEWLENRYGFSLKPNQSLSLMDGKRVKVQVPVGDSFELVTVWFDYSESEFNRFAWLASSPGSIYFPRKAVLPDVSEIDFQLQAESLPS